MEALRLVRFRSVKDDRPATTTSSSFVDDPYAQVEIHLAERSTVLVIYQTHNELDHPQDTIGRGSAISVDGADVAITWDSPGGSGYPARNVSVWVGRLEQGPHIIKGRFCSAMDGYASTVSSRVLLVLVFTGDWFYYTEDSRPAFATTIYDVPDPYAYVEADIAGGARVIALYNIVGELGWFSGANGTAASLEAVNIDYSPTGKMGYDPYHPRSALAALSFVSPGGTVVVRGLIASTGGTAVVNRRQFAVLVLDPASAEVDYMRDMTHFSTTSTELVDDPYAVATRDVAWSTGVLLAVAVGFKVDPITEGARGTRYGLSVDGVDVSFTRGSKGDIYAINSVPCVYLLRVSRGVHVIKGRISSNYPTELARVTSRHIVAVWFEYPPTIYLEDIAISDEWVWHPRLPPPGITVDGFIVPAYLDEWGRVRVNGVLEDGTIVIAVPVAPPPPPAVREFVTAMSFPMVYMAKPARAQQLISKVEGAAVVRVARDYPELLIKRNRANELRSKF